MSKGDGETHALDQNDWRDAVRTGCNTWEEKMIQHFELKGEKNNWN